MAQANPVWEATCRAEPPHQAGRRCLADCRPLWDPSSVGPWRLLSWKNGGSVSSAGARTYPGAENHIPSLENATWLKASGPFPRGNQIPFLLPTVSPWERVCPVVSKPYPMPCCRLWKAAKFHVVFGGNHHFILHPVNARGADHAHDMLPWALLSVHLWGPVLTLSSQKWLFPNPVVFPAVLTSHKPCNRWTTSVTACWRPAPQPRQSCRLPSPHLGGVCSTSPLVQYGTATTPAQRCLTVVREAKTKLQMQEYPWLPFPLFGLVPRRQQRCWGAADEEERRSSAGQMPPQPLGPALRSSWLCSPPQRCSERRAWQHRRGSQARRG